MSLKEDISSRVEEQVYDYNYFIDKRNYPTADVIFHSSITEKIFFS